MPEGRTTVRSELLMQAKSIDRAEHSGTLKGVMAVEQVDARNKKQMLHYHTADMRADLWPDSDRQEDRHLRWRRFTHTLHATCTPR